MVSRRMLPVSPRVVLERSAAGARLRRRVGALGGWTVVTGAMLVILGFGQVVVAAVAVLAGGATLGTAVWALRRHRLWEKALAGSRTAWPSSRAVTEKLTAEARTAAPVVASSLAGGGRRLLGELLCAATASREVAAKLAAEARRQRTNAAASARSRRAVAARREALRLNAEGVDLRRKGEPELAVERHRAALSLFAEVGDQRDAALTQNNIALALARTGADGEAIAYFEQAISTLRALDDREREGQVIANLGVTHLRHGRAERANELLLTALEKLEPGSAARPQVERQLRRAS